MYNDGEDSRNEEVLNNESAATLMPPWSAFHSRVVGEDPYESRILRFPLVPGPSIDHSSIYTALKYAQHIYTWTDTAIGKTVITLDLDLYFRALQLVQSDDAIQGVLSPRLA